MYDNEKLNKLLEDGEAILWSGAPQTYGIFDETHKNSTIISLCWALVWGIILVGGYLTLSVSHGQEIKKGVLAVCSVIPLLVAWGPMANKNNIKKLLYAVTNKKAIVVSQEDGKPLTMRIADIDGLRIEKTNNGNCHVKLGSPVFKASPRKLPGLAIHGEFDVKDNNDKIYTGLVFYNVSAEDGKAIRDLEKPPNVVEQ